MAVLGRGSYSFASDTTADLSIQVIKALDKAMQPSLKDCKLILPS